MAHGDDDRSKESAVVTVASPRESWREQQRKSPDSLPVSILMNNSPKRTPSLRRRLVGTRGRPASPSPPLPSHSQQRRHRRHGAKHNPNDVRRRQTLLAALVITACRLARPSRSRHHPSPSRTRLGPIRTLNKPRLHGGRPPRLRHRRHLYSASESAFQPPPPFFFSSQQKPWNPKKERPHIPKLTEAYTPGVPSSPTTLPLPAQFLKNSSQLACASPGAAVAHALLTHAYTGGIITSAIGPLQHDELTSQMCSKVSLDASHPRHDCAHAGWEA